MRGPPEIIPKVETWQAALESAASGDSGLTFVDLREQETFVPWALLAQRARRLASSLVAMGIRRGDRVALVLPTGPEFIQSFFGSLLAGAVPVPLYPPIRLGKLDEYYGSTARMLQVTGARLVITDFRVRALFGRPLAKARPDLGCKLADELTRESTEVALPGSADDLALIQFSSGTTVDPKPVALTHRNLLFQCAALHQMIRESCSPPHVGVSWLPLYHDMGLIGSLLSAVYYPGHLVLIPPENFLARPSLWLRAISRHRATASSAPNFAYGLCVRRIRDEEMKDVNLASWRLAGNGAESISMKVMKKFTARFQAWGFAEQAFAPGYGLAEASLALTSVPPSSGPTALRIDPSELAKCGRAVTGEFEIVSVGPPSAGVELEVRDKHGAVLPDCRVGRIFARGPSVMSGYFGAPGATSGSLAKGWLDTGDLGFTADGELFISGRAKDVIVIRGANHQPREFESVLEEVEGVRTGCAVALGFIPTGGEGEELLILAERTPLAGGDLAERIRAAVLEKTRIRPCQVEVLAPGTLPRTSSGKLRRAEALRQFSTGQLAAPKRLTPLRFAAELARSALGFAKFGFADEG
jgi:acyl-CoA synthetase (AMP-forming)/AMP-acid ligase II